TQTTVNFLQHLGELQIADFRLQIDCRLGLLGIWLTSTAFFASSTAFFASAPCVQIRAGMNAEKDALKARTKEFALEILRFVRTLPSTDECRDIGSQLRR